MKKFIAFFSLLSLLTGCASNEIVMEPSLLEGQQVEAQANKNGVFWNSYKVRMDFAESTIDGKKYHYVLPAIVVSNGLKEGLFNHLTIKTPSKEIDGYLEASKNGKVYMKPYNSNGPSTFSFNDTLECYEVGSWSKKGNLDPKKLERINFEPLKSFKYEAELHINPMTHEYLTLTSDKEVTPVMLKRSEMVAIAM